MQCTITEHKFAHAPPLYSQSLPLLPTVVNVCVLHWQAVRYSGVTLGAKLLLPGAEGFSPLWRLGAGEHLEWLRPLISWAIAYTPPPTSRSGEHLGV